MNRQVVVAAVIIVFLAGMLLPGMQSTRRPHPEVDAVLSVLYFLEHPARRCGLGDRDAGMLLARVVSTLVCGLALGLGLAFVAKAFGRLRGFTERKE